MDRLAGRKTNIKGDRTMAYKTNSNKKTIVALWTVQALLAALFVFAGSMKFIIPIETMTQQMPLPGWFLHFIGVCEILGGIGLVLPGLLRIHEELTPIAAAGLVIIM